MTANQINFRQSETVKALEEWWSELSERRRGRRGRGGDRAQLRRCRSSLEVVACPAFHRLFHRLQPLGRVDGSRLAPAAAVLAHVKGQPEGPGRTSFARTMASPRPGGDQPRVSGLRFRRLLALEDREELLVALVRIVRLLDGTAPVVSLADDIYWWGERVKERWAYDYYATAPQAD